MTDTEGVKKPQTLAGSAFFFVNCCHSRMTPEQDPVVDACSDCTLPGHSLYFYKVSGCFVVPIDLHGISRTIVTLSCFSKSVFLSAHHVVLRCLF